MIQEYICKICNKQYKNRVQLVRHMNAKHEDEKIIYKINKCANPNCNNELITYTWKDMENIIIVGDINKKYCSMECLKKYNPMQKYDQKLKCPICNKDIVNSKILERHLKVCKERICELCGKKFYNAGKYYKHVSECKNKLYKCDFCEKTFKSHNGLTKHLSHVHKDKRIENFVKCANDKCNNLIKYYSIGSFIEYHNKYCCKDCIEIKQNKEPISKNFKCPACKCSFETEEKLELHFNKTHIKDGFKFICNQCSATFATKSQLHAHYYGFHKEKIINIGKKCDYEECNNIVDKIIIDNYVISEKRFCNKKCSSKQNNKSSALKFWRGKDSYNQKYRLSIQNYNGCKWFDFIDSRGNKHRCQGIYELAFAKKLNELNIEFITHPKGIKYINDKETYYFPDFFIPSKNLYVDTKAKYYLILSGDKFIKFRDQNPEINLLILTEELLKCYGINNIYKYVEDLIGK